MKVVVAGGTGFIGRPLVRAFADRGDEVVVITRKPRTSDDPRIRFAVATDDAAMMREAAGVDAIIGLAGAGVMDERWSQDRLDELKNSRVRSTALLARTAIACKARVFVSASAIGIYGMQSSDDTFEDGTRKEPPHGTDVLAKICEEWEAAAAPARAAGVRVAHPRIGIVLGRDGGALASMIPPFKAFIGGPLGSGKQWVSWIHVDDAVASMVLAVDDVRFTSTYNCVAPNPVRNETLALEIGHALNRPSKVRTPAFAIKLALGADRAETVLTGQRVLPTRLQSFGFRYRFPDLIPALEDVIPDPHREHRESTIA